MAVDGKGLLRRVSNSTLTLGKTELLSFQLGTCDYFRQMNWWRQLPNALTLTNLMFGSVAIMALSQHNVVLALILIVGSLIADILDGAIARKMGVDGELGIQLDSLADVVSFGVLPAMMIYMLNVEDNDDTANIIFMFISSLVAVSAGLRLARFNVDTRPREYFWGLPTPAGAILVAGWILSVFVGYAFDWSRDTMHIVSIALVLFLAILYQVPLKLPGLKSPKPGKITALIILLLAIGLFFFIGPITIPLAIITYVLCGILNLLIKWY